MTVNDQLGLNRDEQLRYDQNRPVVAAPARCAKPSIKIETINTMHRTCCSFKGMLKERTDFGYLELIADLSEKGMTLLACNLIFNTFCCESVDNANNAAALCVFN